MLPFTQIGVYIIGGALLCSILAFLFVSLTVAVLAVVYPVWSALRWAVRRALPSVTP